MIFGEKFRCSGQNGDELSTLSVISLSRPTTICSMVSDHTSFSLVVEKWKGQVSREQTSDKQRWSSGIIFDILRVETRSGVLVGSRKWYSHDWRQNNEPVIYLLPRQDIDTSEYWIKAINTFVAVPRVCVCHRAVQPYSSMSGPCITL